MGSIAQAVKSKIEMVFMLLCNIPIEGKERRFDSRSIETAPDGSGSHQSRVQGMKREEIEFNAEDLVSSVEALAATRAAKRNLPSGPRP